MANKGGSNTLLLPLVPSVPLGSEFAASEVLLPPLLAIEEAVPFVPGGSCSWAVFVSGFCLASSFFSLGSLVVTLAMGTVITLARLRVSISAVTDMPGRNASFSLIRILTSNLVASGWHWRRRRSERCLWRN